MRGLDAATGRALEGDAYLAQLIGKAMTTPIGSRPHRRDLGSIIPELIDQPLNPATRQRLFAAAAVVLRQWFPFLRLRRLSLTRDPSSGAVDLAIEIVKPSPGKANTYDRLTVPLRPRGHLPSVA